jgi:hypothetical protein
VGPGGSQKQREHPFLFQVLLKLMQPMGRVESGDPYLIIHEWVGA